MINDPIIEEIHRSRAAEIKRFEYDFKAYFRDLKKREKQLATPVLPPPEGPFKPTLRVRPARS